MTVAAFVVSIVGVLAAAAGVVYARQSVRSARASELAAKESAEAARQLAETQAARLKLDQDRAHLEMTPVLMGVIKRQPIPSRPGMVTYRLEVHIKTPQPVVALILRLPENSCVGTTRSSIGMAQDLSYPEPGKPSPSIEPGHPASWRVEVDDLTASHFTALASCRGKKGKAGMEFPST